MASYTFPRGAVLLANVITCLCLLGVSSCSIDRQGTLPPGVNWSVEPPLFCPGDPVTVSWDFNRMERSPGNCRPRPGGYAVGEPIRCVAGSDCPASPAGICLDNACCTNEMRATSPARCPTEDGCLPAFVLTVRAAPPLPTEPVINRESNNAQGERTVTPSATTTFTMDLDITPPVVLVRQTKTATMITSRTGDRADAPVPIRLLGWHDAGIPTDRPHRQPDRDRTRDHHQPAEHVGPHHSAFGRRSGARAHRVEARSDNH